MRGLPRPFLVWLALFYAGWLTLVLSRGLLPLVLANWPMAASMALGSFVAGSTPMGGGSVGFPVLVLLFEQPVDLGRDFSFAVQSIGMTSASIFILSSRQVLHWRTLAPALAGVAVGTPLGLLFVVDHLPALGVKLLFSVSMAAFGLLHLRRSAELVGLQGMRLREGLLEPLLGLVVGLLGGASIAAATGVGTDMLLYMVLVLLSRVDLRVAIPTSVVLMAATSLVGIGTQLASGHVNPAVLGPWLAAAPVVAIGAPLGAFVVARVGRRAALLFVSVLCLLQLAWTCSDSWPLLGVWGLAAVAVAVLVAWGVFEGLHVAGDRLAVAERG